MEKSSFIMVIDIKENQQEFAPGNFIWSRIVLNSDHLNWISVLTEYEKILYLKGKK